MKGSSQCPAGHRYTPTPQLHPTPWRFKVCFGQRTYHETRGANLLSKVAVPLLGKNSAKHLTQPFHPIFTGDPWRPGEEIPSLMSLPVQGLTQAALGRRRDWYLTTIRDLLWAEEVGISTKMPLSVSALVLLHLSSYLSLRESTEAQTRMQTLDTLAYTPHLSSQPNCKALVSGVVKWETSAAGEVH